MKKVLLSILISCSFIFGYSQDCTTMWPYVYPDFKDATVYIVGGQKYYFKVNVHVKESTIHYLDGTIIKETLSRYIFFVEIGDDRYMCVEGRIMKVLGNTEEGFIATLILGDFDKASESDGAYGTTSSVSATQKISSISIGGLGSMTSYTALLGDKDSGKSLDLTYKYYIVVNDEIYSATKKGINAKLDEVKKTEFKVFLKENKVKWKNPESLMVLLDFFKS